MANTGDVVADGIDLRYKNLVNCLGVRDQEVDDAGISRHAGAEIAVARSVIQAFESQTRNFRQLEIGGRDKRAIGDLGHARLRRGDVLGYPVVERDHQRP